MEELVRIARETVKEFLQTRKFKLKKIEKFKEKRGVFVSIHAYPEKDLRGCIGFPYPKYPLFKAVQIAAIQAAFQDPRFPPLTEEELDRVVFEISVLTKPEDVKQEKIECGKDGLIIQCGGRGGLLLPQVWEQIPQKKEFLKCLCWKAGLSETSLSDGTTKLQRFRVEALSEVKPNDGIKKTVE